MTGRLFPPPPWTDSKNSRTASPSLALRARPSTRSTLRNRSWVTDLIAPPALAAEQVEPPRDPGHLKHHVQLVDPFRMRRMVAGGIGIAALAWTLGSSNWRDYWSQFWTTARTQTGAPDAVSSDHSSMTDASVSIERESVLLP